MNRKAAGNFHGVHYSSSSYEIFHQQELTLFDYTNRIGDMEVLNKHKLRLNAVMQLFALIS